MRRRVMRGTTAAVVAAVVLGGAARGLAAQPGEEPPPETSPEARPDRKPPRGPDALPARRPGVVHAKDIRPADIADQRLKILAQLMKPEYTFKIGRTGVLTSP